MEIKLLHTLPASALDIDFPSVLISPYTLPPHPLAALVANETIEYIHNYILSHPETELKKQGKMFGVLVVQCTDGRYGYLRAFSAKLDGKYIHNGFVPPIYVPSSIPCGNSSEESKRLQLLLFSNFYITNSIGQRINLIDIFKCEKKILSVEEWYSHNNHKFDNYSLPPTGTGECCAPKLLQYAINNQLKPLALAEFWVGAAPINELRKEGYFYTPCSSKCVPLLRYLLQGIEIQKDKTEERVNTLCKQIQIIFEDSYLIVVNKPAGLLSVPGKTSDLSVVTYLQKEKNIPNLQAAHRLDQDTSGLLILAKKTCIYKELQAYFQRRDILKRYEAIIIPNTTHSIAIKGQIHLPLLPNPFDRPRQIVDYNHGKVAISSYKIREYRPDGTLFVDFFLHTGRTHQLRIHSAHYAGLNAPIVGDRLYGQAYSSRLMLHAAEISFIHPYTKEEMHFCIPSNF